MTQRKRRLSDTAKSAWRRSKAHVRGMNVVWREPPRQFCESLQTTSAVPRRSLFKPAPVPTGRISERLRFRAAGVENADNQRSVSPRRGSGDPSQRPRRLTFHRIPQRYAAQTRHERRKRKSCCSRVESFVRCVACSAQQCVSCLLSDPHSMGTFLLNVSIGTDRVGLFSTWFVKYWRHLLHH